MKVLHIIPSIGDLRGGPSQVVIDMVYALRMQGVDAEIVTTNDNGSGLLDVPLGRHMLYAQVPITFFSRFSPSFEAVREFAFSRELTRWLWKHMDEYDLVHVHALFSYVSTVAMAIARFKRIPYITIPHGSLCEWSLQQGALKKNVYLTLIERSNLNAASVLHFTGGQEAREAATLNLSAPRVIIPLILPEPMPVLDARLRLRRELNIPLDQPVILYMSRLHPVKGLEYLIPALGKLVRERFTFVIAGSGTSEYELTVQDLLAKAGIQERTHWAGFVRGEQKGLLLNGVDLFALTSHSENFGIVVLEAMAVATPVLITPGVPLAATVARLGLGYAPELDVEAVATALGDFLHNRQVAMVMGQRAQQFVLEHYGRENVSSKLLQVYEAILNQTPLPSFLTAST